MNDSTPPGITPPLTITDAPGAPVLAPVLPLLRHPLMTRRGALGAAAGLAAMAWLQGCASRSSARSLPQPVWPDQEQARIASSTPRATPMPPPAAQPRVAQAPAGAIVPRSAWVDGQPRWQHSKPMNGVRVITIHHDALATGGQSGWGFSVNRLRSVRRSHMGRGPEWVDIGYHYIIDPDGRVWEGRPLSIEGAHVARTNDHNLGIMLMGNFDEQSPTNQQLATLDGFVAAQMRRHNVGVRNVYTHQELKPTACPGRNLQRYMLATRGSRGRLARA